MLSHFIFTGAEKHTIYGNSTLHDQIHRNHTDGSSSKITSTLISYMTIYCLIIFLVIVLNIIIIISLKPYQKRKRSNVEVLILYLSTFDMMASIMIIVDVYETITNDFRLGSVGCKLIYPIYQIELNMSICILMIMSVDRCRSLSSPTKKKFSKKAIHLAVFVALVISTILQTYQFIALHENKNGNCYRDRSLLSFGIPRLIVTISRDLILIIVIILTSVIIYKAVKSNIVFTTYTKEKKEKVLKKIKMLIIMELVFAILVVPYDVYDSVMQTLYILHIQVDYTEALQNFDSIVTIFQMSNSFANFFIYLKMYRYLVKQPRFSTNFDENAKTETMNIRRDNHGYHDDDL